jgi:hypothetical protein
MRRSRSIRGRRLASHPDQAWGLSGEQLRTVVQNCFVDTVRHREDRPQGARGMLGATWKYAVIVSHFG